jgi:hypothetical protein
VQPDILNECDAMIACDAVVEYYDGVVIPHTAIGGLIAIEGSVCT